MPVREGYWVEKDAQGRYVKRPVQFFFDEQGNLLGMRDPYGGVKQFYTQYSVSNKVHSYFANACDYFIATVPTDRWVPVDPWRWGFVDANGRVWPLQHSIEDICRKRADVCDYIRKTYGVRVPGTTVNSQANTIREQTATATGPKYVGCAIFPQMRVNTPATNKIDPGLGVGMINLIEQFARAMVSMGPPGTQELFNAMWNEGMRQELILTQRLSDKDLQTYYRLRQMVNEAHTRGEITNEQFHALHNAIYRAAVRKAGLTEEELLTSSPYVPQMARALGQLPGGTQMAGAIERRLTEAQKLKLIREQIQKLSPEQKRALLARLQGYAQARTV